MITPIELQNKTFRSGIGYDKKDVEAFMEDLHKNYEFLYKDNLELNDKINVLNEGLSYYKTVEKTIQKALILAEQTAEETKESARQKAKAIEIDARAKAQIILADAKTEYNRLREETVHLMRQYESYKAQFKHLAAAQLEILESDTFKIQMGNLDLFNSQEVEETEEDEINSNYNVNLQSYGSNDDDMNSVRGYEKEVAASKEVDDFEFLDME